MSFIRDLTVDNPMLAEISRRTLRLKLSRDNRMSAFIALGLVVLTYLTFALLFAQAPYFSGWQIAALKLPVFCAVLPLAMHASIAGERDKRSWDALCCAPVTDAQIVAGKVLAGLVFLVAIAVAFLPVELAAMTTLREGDKWKDLAILARMDAYSLAFAFFVLALSFLCSARSKRPFAALGATVGALGCMLAVSIITLVGEPRILGHMFYAPVVALFNPIIHVVQITSQGDPNDWLQQMSAGIAMAPEIGAACYVGLALAALVYATKTLHASDQEAVVSPKTVSHA